MLRRWRRIADEYADTPLGPRVFVAEAWLSPAEAVRAVEAGEMAMLPPPDEPLPIIEHRSPIADLQKRFPILARLERDLFERVLHAPVKRVDESKSPERYRVVFEIGKPAT